MAAMAASSAAISCARSTSAPDAMPWFPAAAETSASPQNVPLTAKPYRRPGERLRPGCSVLRRPPTAISIGASWETPRMARDGESELTGRTVELLQQLIRNQCVNDGTPESGHEIRNAEVLQALLEGAGLDIELYEPTPGRTSLVARIEGSDPVAPSLCLMGHTDVVPVNPAGWSRDPFGGEVVDGVVWGRGAVDMLNLTSSMAVATKRLAQQGFTPEGTLIYLAVADEEALGTHGAKHLTEHEADVVQADYVITESGGIPMPGPAGTKLPVVVGEKGAYWCTLRIKGTPGH